MTSASHHLKQRISNFYTGRIQVPSWTIPENCVKI